VRRALGLRLTGEHYDEACVLADVHSESSLRWEKSYFHPSRQLLTFPRPDNLVLAILDDQARDRSGTEPALEDMQRLVDERSPDNVRLKNTVWPSKFRVSHRMVNQFPWRARASRRRPVHTQPRRAVRG
jgi:2-polyprenyl-6-methoxyphenol hydroxylase-like FAD-dependent oxidoreductase